jgi:intein/homing endonuclease
LSKKSDFLEKSDFSNRVPKRTQEIRFFLKNRISFEMEWSGNFRFRVLVHTENGLKPISEVKVGDKVLSYDERTETTRYQPVMAVIEQDKRTQMISITLDSGKSLEATAEHPFYIKGKGWNIASARRRKSPDHSASRVCSWPKTE